MSGTIKSTEHAHTQAHQLLHIINNEFHPVIHKMHATGHNMSDPNHWDGPLAHQFRGEIWPQAKADLDRMRDALEKLQTDVKRILNNITVAGGGHQH